MRTRRSLPTLTCLALIGCLALAFAPAVPAAAPASPSAQGKVPPLRGNPSDRRLASQFLLLLQARDRAGLRAFFAPQFLLQRGDGSFLNKAQYLADPAEVDSFKVRGVVGTRAGEVRVVRFEANTKQRIDGKEVAGGWIPRLSTFVKRDGTWQIIAHANFLLPPSGQ